MTWLLFLKRWWKPLAIVLVLLVSHGLAAGFAYHTAKLAGSLALQSERLTIANDARKQIEQAQQQAYEAEQAREAMRRKLAAYKPKVVERVRQNPSGCNLPKPVADGLRDQVRATNEAIVSAAGKPA